jgi:hypothetical protein
MAGMTREFAFLAAWAMFWVSIIGLVSAFTAGPLWAAQYLTITMAAGLAGLVWVWPRRDEPWR